MSVKYFESANLILVQGPKLINVLYFDEANHI